MSKSNHPNKVSPLTRPGEGILVDMHPVPNTGVTGGGTLALRGDVSKIEVPNRRYSADICFLDYSKETVSVLFAQEKHIVNELRSLLIIKMTPESIIQFLDMIDTASAPTLNDLADSGKFPIDPMPDFTAEPKETVALNANLILAAASGREACMDFYYASPFSKAGVAQTKKMALDPVVRVDLRTSMLLSLIIALRDLIKDLPEAEKGEPR